MTNRTQEVLYESEAALRLVDNELNELHEVQTHDVLRPAAELTGGMEGLNDIAALLNRANTQILAVLARIREGKAAIEHTATGRVKMPQDKLRDELPPMTRALQVQDITAQQLAHASSVLDEMAQRLFEVARLFDPAISPDAPRALRDLSDTGSGLFAANASMRGSDSRPALADEIFTAVKGHAP